jgi:hypothetical protein
MVPYEFKNSSVYVKNVIGILMGAVLNLRLLLVVWSLILSIHEHGRSYHLLVSSAVFSSVLYTVYLFNLFLRLL